MAEAAVATPEADVKEAPQTTEATEPTETPSEPESKGTEQSAPSAPEDKGETKTPEAPAWDSNWREIMAGGDEKELKYLQRYKTPADYYKGDRERRKLISSGELKRDLPKDATEEDIAAYRKERGIPETPEGYLESLGDREISDDDKVIIGHFLENYAHKHNLTPEQAKGPIEWYFELAKMQEQVLQEQDTQRRDAARDYLREQWGGDFTANDNAVKNHLSRVEEDLRGYLEKARGPDGSRILDNPKVMEWLAGNERSINPQATVSPSTYDGGKSLDDVIGDFEQKIAKNPRFLQDNPKEFARYKDLLEAQRKRNG